MGLIRANGSAPRKLADDAAFVQAAAAERRIRDKVGALERERSDIVRTLFEQSEAKDGRERVAKLAMAVIDGGEVMTTPSSAEALKGRLVAINDEIVVLREAAKITAERRREVALRVGLEIVERDFSGRHRASVKRIAAALAELRAAVGAERAIRAEAMAATGNNDLLPPFDSAPWLKLGENDLMCGDWEKRARKYTADVEG